MWSAVFCLLLITAPRDGRSGFTSGAPCSERNTALMEAKGSWRMPKQAVECVDITSMGRRQSLPQSFEITSASTLYADHMRLAAVPEFAFTTMAKLRMIDLSGNLLRRLPKDAFLPLKKLHTLLLEDNRVLVPKRVPLLNSPCLKTLSLSNNRIRRLRPRTFQELPALTVLYLDRNWLTVLRTRVFRELKYLKYLHLGNNRLKALPHLTLLAPKAVVITKGNPLNGTEVIKR